MSKSYGNVVDPLELAGRYGADALRFALTRAASPGHDVPLAEEWVEGARNFVNKLWNSARFVAMNLDGRPLAELEAAGPPPVERACPAGPVDPVPPRPGDRRGRRGVRALRVRPGRPEAAGLLLGRVLRLVPRDGQAAARRRPGQPGAGPAGAGHGAECHPAPASPGGALRHRGTVGPSRRRRPADHRPLARRGRRRGRRGGRRCHGGGDRDRVGHPPVPLGAQGRALEEDCRPRGAGRRRAGQRPSATSPPRSTPWPASNASSSSRPRPAAQGAAAGGGRRHDRHPPRRAWSTSPPRWPTSTARSRSTPASSPTWRTSWPTRRSSRRRPTTWSTSMRAAGRGRGGPGDLAGPAGAAGHARR